MDIAGAVGDTLIGGAAGTLLPTSVVSALGIAIYGMFLAVFIPPMKKSWPVAAVVAIAAILSCGFNYISVLSSVSGGFVIIICAVVAATAGALLKPVEEE